MSIVRALVAVTLLAAVAVPPAPAADTPKTTIERLSNKVLDVLHTNASVADKRKRI